MKNTSCMSGRRVYYATVLFGTKVERAEEEDTPHVVFEQPLHCWEPCSKHGLSPLSARCLALAPRERKVDEHIPLGRCARGKRRQRIGSTTCIHVHPLAPIESSIRRHGVYMTESWILCIHASHRSIRSQRKCQDSHVPYRIFVSKNIHSFMRVCPA